MAPSCGAVQAVTRAPGHRMAPMDWGIRTTARFHLPKLIMGPYLWELITLQMVPRFIRRRCRPEAGIKLLKMEWGIVGIREPLRWPSIISFFMSLSITPMEAARPAGAAKSVMEATGAK